MNFFYNWPFPWKNLRRVVISGLEVEVRIFGAAQNVLEVYH